MLNFIKKLFTKVPEEEKEFPDPVKCCELYKDRGCSHVDGFLCKPKTCNERLSYRQIIFHQRQAYGDKLSPSKD